MIFVICSKVLARYARLSLARLQLAGLFLHGEYTVLITPHCPVALLPHQPARSCACANKMVSCAALLASCSLEAPRFQLLSWPGIAVRLVAIDNCFYPWLPLR